MFSSSVELTKVGSKVEDILASLAKMLEEDKQKEKELTVSLGSKESGCLCLLKILFYVHEILNLWEAWWLNPRQGVGIPNKWMGVLVIPFMVNKMVLVRLRVLTLTSSTVRTFKAHVYLSAYWAKKYNNKQLYKWKVPLVIVFITIKVYETIS